MAEPEPQTPEADPTNEFTLLFRECVVKSGLRQIELAEKIGITPSELNQWLQGLSFPSPKNLSLLLQLLPKDTKEFDSLAAYIEKSEETLKIRLKELETTLKSLPPEKRALFWQAIGELLTKL